MKLLVGLGNPGEKYDGTRHNAGAMAVEAFRLRHAKELSGWKSRFRSLVTEGHIGQEKIVLLLPQTFMNKSGLAVREAVDFWKVGLEDLLVVSDDITLPLGSLRLRRQGSSGGHNGLKSILEMMSTNEIPRLRVGVGNVEIYNIPAEQFVLGRFNAGERKTLRKELDQAAQAMETVIDEGIEEAMNRFN